MSGLIKTPFLEDSESTMGYLLRLANANGFDGLPKFKAAIGKLIPCHDLRQITKSDLAEITGYEEHDLWPHIGSYYMPGKHTYFFRFARDEQPFLPKESMNFMTPRVCPLCVSENKYLSHCWDHGLTVHCTKHDLLLQDQCPSCREYLTWSRPYLLQCNCGFELSSFTVEKVPQCVSQFHWLMFEYRQGDKPIRRTWMRGWPRWFHGLKAGQVSRGVLRFIHLGLSRQWQEPDMRADFGLRVADVVEGMGVIMPMLMSNYPFAFQLLRLLPDEVKSSEEDSMHEIWRHPDFRAIANRRAMRAFQIKIDSDVDNSGS